MWIFSKDGHLSLAQHPTQPDCLVVQAQQRPDMDSFVSLLNEVSGAQHEIQPGGDSGYCCTVVARKSTVAQAVAKLVSDIDYGHFVQSMHFDFGAQPGFLTWITPTGLQVARVKPE